MNIEENKEDEITDSVNKYYQLKMKYESNIKIIKDNIKENFNSTREKRNAFIRSKIKCVNCNRPVKSIFQTVYNKDTNSRSLIAKCGDIIDPCSLKINIDIGYNEMLPDLIIEEEKKLSNLKNDIIKEKNNALFGYITNEEAISNFEKIKEDVSEFTEMLELYYQMHLNTKPKKDEINSLQYNIYEIIDTIKREVNANKPENAIEIYLSELKPELNKLMKSKYRMNYVDYDDKSDIYTLIQRPNTMDDYEMFYGKPKLISYITDLQDNQKKKKGEKKKGEKKEPGEKKEGEKKKRKKKEGDKKEGDKKEGEKKKREKELTEKQKSALRVKNNEPIDFGDSDEEDEEDAYAKQAQEEREIDQEH